MRRGCALASSCPAPLLATAACGGDRRGRPRPGPTRSRGSPSAGSSARSPAVDVDAPSRSPSRLKVHRAGQRRPDPARRAGAAPPLRSSTAPTADVAVSTSTPVSRADSRSRRGPVLPVAHDGLVGRRQGAGSRSPPPLKTSYGDAGRTAVRAQDERLAGVGRRRLSRAADDRARRPRGRGGRRRRPTLPDRRREGRRGHRASTSRAPRRSRRKGSVVIPLVRGHGPEAARATAWSPSTTSAPSTARRSRSTRPSAGGADAVRVGDRQLINGLGPGPAGAQARQPGADPRPAGGGVRQTGQPADASRATSTLAFVIDVLGVDLDAEVGSRATWT